MVASQSSLERRGGIGFAIASRMVAAGAHVVVNDIDPDALGTAKTRLQPQAAGRRVHAIRADVAARDEVTALVAETMSEFGSLDILVNNAGFYAPTPLEKLDTDVIDRRLAVNVKGLLYMSAAAAEVMKPGSAIVHISSPGGLRPPFGGLSVYHATKGAVDSLTRDMAVSWGPQVYA
jgi:NAD(P)-dependent dehydrogenase (short-subunit alcohol dehydrogenase family)